MAIFFGLLKELELLSIISAILGTGAGKCGGGGEKAHT